MCLAVEVLCTIVFFLRFHMYCMHKHTKENSMHVILEINLILIVIHQ